MNDLYMTPIVLSQNCLVMVKFALFDESGACQVLEDAYYPCGVVFDNCNCMRCIARVWL